MERQISPGDLLLVDTAARRIRDYGVYAIELDHEIAIRRVRKKTDGSIVLINDNALHGAEEVTAETAAKLPVIGKVIWRGGKI